MYVVDDSESLRFLCDNMTIICLHIIYGLYILSWQNSDDYRRLLRMPPGMH